MNDKRLWAWKAIDVDFTTRNGFVWPFPGGEASDVSDLNPDNPGPCPSRRGDGLCIARTWLGAAARGAATHAVLIVSYFADDVLGEDNDKLRVRRCYVHWLIDAQKLIRAKGRGADLRGADLSYADLRDADLSGADLRGADLRGADLRDADLRGADLRGADLSYADLRGADLRGADLRDADLRGADLRGADLRDADLRDADLSGANLRDANLRDAIGLPK